MKRLGSIAAVLLVALIGFWGGYSVALYRTAHEHMPAAARFSELQLASFMVRSAELVDRGETAPLRQKSFALAKSKLEPIPYVLPSIWTVATSPLLLEEQSGTLRSLNDAEVAELALKLERLERPANLAQERKSSNGS